MYIPVKNKNKQTNSSTEFGISISVLGHVFLCFPCGPAHVSHAVGRIGQSVIHSLIVN